MKRSSAIGLTVGIIYALIYLALAIGAAGAGHGTFIFFAPISPYCLGLVFFPLMGFLAGDLRPFLSRVIFLSALVVHYALTIIFLRVEWLSDLSYVEKMWAHSPWGHPAAGGLLPAWADYNLDGVHPRRRHSGEPRHLTTACTRRPAAESVMYPAVVSVMYIEWECQ